MTKFGLAQSIRRVEDPRLLKGNGRYTDDIVLPGMLHGIVLRSPHAAAKLGMINTTAAASVAGVKAIYTAAELRADGIGPLPCAAPVQNRDVRVVLVGRVVKENDVRPAPGKNSREVAGNTGMARLLHV